LRIYGERSVTFSPSETARKGDTRSHWPLWLCLPLILVSPLGPLAVFASQLKPPAILWETWQDNAAEITNTLFLATTASLIMTGLAFSLAAAWLSWTPRPRNTALLLTLLPAFVAPILLGLALIQFYNRPLFAAVYGGLPATGWPLQDWAQDNLARYGMELIGYVARFLPLAVLLVAEAVRRTDPSLLEVAQSLGAPPRRVHRTILAPLLAPSLIGTFILLWTLCSSELSTSVLVQQPGGQPLTIPLFQQMHIFNLGAVSALCLTLAGLGAVAFLAAALLMKWWQRK
jgi:ABC-type Fe3+ transport system permease subunit